VRVWQPKTPISELLFKRFKTKQKLAKFLGVSVPKLDRFLADEKKLLIYTSELTEVLHISANIFLEMVNDSKKEAYKPRVSHSKGVILKDNR
jgi:plasmid maintenance system antidote protein VapI